jgi:hypothetical protein
MFAAISCELAMLARDLRALSAAGRSSSDTAERPVVTRAQCFGRASIADFCFGSAWLELRGEPTRPRNTRLRESSKSRARPSESASVARWRALHGRARVRISAPPA